MFSSKADPEIEAGRGVQRSQCARDLHRQSSMLISGSSRARARARAQAADCRQRKVMSGDRPRARRRCDPAPCRGAARGPRSWSADVPARRIRLPPTIVPLHVCPHLRMCQPDGDKRSAAHDGGNLSRSRSNLVYVAVLAAFCCPTVSKRGPHHFWCGPVTCGNTGRGDRI